MVYLFIYFFGKLENFINQAQQLCAFMFTTLNNISNYTLHLKLLEFTVNTLIYNSCYILHHVVNSGVILDQNPKFRVQCNCEYSLKC